MAETTIEWTRPPGKEKGYTWNPTTGCTRKHLGCTRCYAETQSFRLEKMGQEKYTGVTTKNPVTGEIRFNGVVKTHEDTLGTPFSWKKPGGVFVNSMSDLFHKDVPVDFIDKVYAVMAMCPQHTFMVLTKRPDRMAQYLNDEGTIERIEAAGNNHIWPIWYEHNQEDPPPPWYMDITYSEFGKDADLQYTSDELPANVWHGVTVVNQETYDEAIPWLGMMPGVRFLSYEPALGAIDLGQGKVLNESLIPNWIIAGGESGNRKPRPLHPNWITSMRDQCEFYNIPFFFKQWGAWIPKSQCEGVVSLHGLDLIPDKNTETIYESGELRLPDSSNWQEGGATVYKLGKSVTGRKLDGIEHNAYPVS